MFDKIKFAQILKNITDTYESQRTFSKKSEINRTYLSQYMNMKLEDPPKPKILEKLANSSNGITTYNELMQVCGYTYLTELNSTSFGINLNYWKMIFGDIEKVELTQNGATFFASFLDTILQESERSENSFIDMDLNPELFIPFTNNADEFIEYTKIFCFVICSFISNGMILLDEQDKQILLNDIQMLLNDIPNKTKGMKKDFRYASHNSINTDGLDENDIEEINRFVEFIKNKKKKK